MERNQAAVRSHGVGSWSVVWVWKFSDFDDETFGKGGGWGWLLQVFGARGLSRPPDHHWHPELFTERARHLTVDPAEGTQPCNFPTRSQATERTDTYACRTPCSQARRHGQSGWMRLIWGKRVLATDISPRPVCQCHSSFIVPYLSDTISIVAPG